MNPVKTNMKTSMKTIMKTNMKTKNSSVLHVSEDVLGNGISGSVYSGVWVLGDVATKVAVKSIEIDTGLEMIESESWASMTLDHPNIIKYVMISPDEEDRFVNLVMRKMDTSLSAYVDRTPRMHPPRLEAYVDRLVSAVKHMHMMNVAHRDIKTANILVMNDTFELKLADFGHSCRIGDKRREGKVYRMYANTCTLNYRPPELLGQQIVSKNAHAFMPATESTPGHIAAVDLWSLGCVIAEMVIGRTLFVGTTRTTVFRSIMRVLGPDGCGLMANPDIRNAPKRVRDVLSRLLRIDALQRTLFSFLEKREDLQRVTPLGGGHSLMTLSFYKIVKVWSKGFHGIPWDP
jgi:serine/threonine protein kinase